MGVEVYIDLYFLVNASMDFFCLLITGRLLHRRMSVWRLLIGALIGGVYAIFTLLLGISGTLGFVADCAVAILLTGVVFVSKGTKIWRVLQSTLVYVLISMAVGGIMTALYTWLNRLDLPFELLQGDSLSITLFGILALVAGIATSRGGRFLGFSEKTKSVTVQAVLLGRSVTLRAMVDTGNFLRDPISGRGVIVAERDRLRGMLPPELLIEGTDGERAVFAWLEKDPRHASLVRLIPTYTATGDGLLTAIVPDRLRISEGKEQYDADYLIAVSSLGDRASGFDAVIPME